jgi:hypothetical protein
MDPTTGRDGLDTADLADNLEVHAFTLVVEH